MSHSLCQIPPTAFALDPLYSLCIHMLLPRRLFSFQTVFAVSSALLLPPMLRTWRTHLFLIYLPAEYIDHFVFLCDP